LQKKGPLIKWRKNIWEKLMVVFTIRSIHLNGTNYNMLLLNYGKKLWGKFMGKIYGKNLLGKLMGKIYGENLWGKSMGKINGEN
jgi:hypothetical protein